MAVCKDVFSALVGIVALACQAAMEWFLCHPPCKDSSECHPQTKLTLKPEAFVALTLGFRNDRTQAPR